MSIPANACLSLTELPGAFENLAHATGMAAHPRKAPTPPKHEQQDDFRVLNNWMQETANWLGFEVESVSTYYQDVNRLLQKASPAILACRHEDQRFFLAILRKCRGGLMVLTKDGTPIKITLSQAHSAFCESLEKEHQEEIDRLILEAGLPQKRLAQAERELFREFLEDERLQGCWLFRASPGSSFLKQIMHEGLGFNIAMLFCAYTLKHLLWVGAWWLVAKSVLQGRFELGTALIWGLMFLAVSPINMITNWNQGLVSIGIGSLLKKRLLYGSSKLEPSEIKGLGYGGLLAKVLESGALESVTLVSAINSSFAMIDLLVAFAALIAGATLFPAVALVAWCVVVVILCGKFVQSMKTWTKTRVQMTDDLVERLSGHRTRLAQEQREHWHDEEDWFMERYLEEANNMDNIKSLCFLFLPRGWLFLGLLCLAPTLILGGESKEAIAFSLGGIFLAFSAFTKLIKSGFYNLALTFVAWDTIKDLFKAATRKEKDSPPVSGLLPEGSPGSFAEPRKVLQAYDLVYAYRNDLPPVLKGVNLEIEEGDRILLMGGSGSGKSTLASILLGLDAPQSGLILLHGLDRHSLGPHAWRHRVSSAPQFQDNHIFHGSLAYNLLMGRNWPPSPQDLALAEEICVALGLGPLLQRMPSGLMQAVGDSGWRLSHGECSRVFIARALLSDAEFIIFDESFGTLDPESMQLALDCVFQRAKSLMVIAHP